MAGQNNIKLLVCREQPVGVRRVNPLRSPSQHGAMPQQTCRTTCIHHAANEAYSCIDPLTMCEPRAACWCRSTTCGSGTSGAPTGPAVRGSPQEEPARKCRRGDTQQCPDTPSVTSSVALHSLHLQETECNKSGANTWHVPWVGLPIAVTCAVVSSSWPPSRSVITFPAP